MSSGHIKRDCPNLNPPHFSSVFPHFSELGIMFHPALKPGTRGLVLNSPLPTSHTWLIMDSWLYKCYLQCCPRYKNSIDTKHVLFVMQYTNRKIYDWEINCNMCFKFINTKVGKADKAGSRDKSEYKDSCRSQCQQHVVSSRT